MKQKDLRKAPLVMLNIALILVVIYLVGTFWIVMNPEFFLRIINIGYEGGYNMPFDMISFSVALGTSIIFVFMYTLLKIKIKKDEQVGLGFGVLLGVLSYLIYFLVTSGLAALVNSRVEQIRKDDTLIDAWIGMGFEESMAAYAFVLAFQEIVELALKTAVILLLIAYGIYCYRKREQNTPKRLYK